MKQNTKSCPFCGGQAQITSVLRDGYQDSLARTGYDPDARAYFYVCYSCAAQGGWGKSEGSALAMWNMRIADNKLDDKTLAPLSEVVDEIINNFKSKP